MSPHGEGCVVLRFTPLADARACAVGKNKTDVAVRTSLAFHSKRAYTDRSLPNGYAEEGAMAGNGSHFPRDALFPLELIRTAIRDGKKQRENKIFDKEQHLPNLFRSSSILFFSPFSSFILCFSFILLANPKSRQIVTRLQRSFLFLIASLVLFFFSLQ